MGSPNQMSTQSPEDFLLTKFPPVDPEPRIADACDPCVSMPAIFVPGCNLRCHYCINRELVHHPERGQHSSSLLLRFLLAKEPWLMVSGGEPLNDLRTLWLLINMKMMGFKVALATNGCFPDRLRRALGKGLVNHVVMDVKTKFVRNRYLEVIGGERFAEFYPRILRSFCMLRSYPGTTVEFRMTMCSKYVGREDAEWLVKTVGGRGIVTLQLFSTHQTLDPQLADEKWVIPFETIRRWAAELSEETCFVVRAKEV